MKLLENIRLKKEVKHLENSRNWYKDRYNNNQEYFSRLITAIEKEGYRVFFNKDEVFIRKKNK